MDQLYICKATHKVGFQFLSAVEAITHVPEGPINTYLEDHYDMLSCTEGSDERVFIAIDHFEPEYYAVKVIKDDLVPLHDPTPFQLSMKPISRQGLLCRYQKCIGYLFGQQLNVIRRFSQHWKHCGNTSEIQPVEYEDGTQSLFIALSDIMAGHRTFVAANNDEILVFKTCQETNVDSTNLTAPAHSAPSAITSDIPWASITGVGTPPVMSSQQSTPLPLPLPLPIPSHLTNRQLELSEAASTADISNQSASTVTVSNISNAIDSLVKRIRMNSDEVLSRSNIWNEIRNLGWRHLNVRNKTNTAPSSAYFPPWISASLPSKVDVTNMEVNCDYFEEPKMVYRYIRLYGMEKVVTVKPTIESSRRGARSVEINQLSMTRGRGRGRGRSTSNECLLTSPPKQKGKKRNKDDCEDFSSNTRSSPVDGIDNTDSTIAVKRARSDGLINDRDNVTKDEVKDLEKDIIHHDSSMSIDVNDNYNSLSQCSCS